MNTAFATAILMLTQTAVGADLSRFESIERPAVAMVMLTPPIMAYNTTHETAVGADLSCTPPIYRPSFTRHHTPLANTQISSIPTEGKP